MHVAELLKAHHQELAPAERRVAMAIVADPEAVAFGTVASLAADASTGGATVLRLTTKLGLDGFSELQGLVREEMSLRLRPAVERIREPASGDVLKAGRRQEMTNLASTLDGLDHAAFSHAVGLLSDTGRRVAVLASSTARGVAIQLVSELRALRAGVSLIHGNQVDVLRQAANLPPRSVVVALDVRRYDSWLLEALDQLDASTDLIAVTDSPLSPLATRAESTLRISGRGVGPFDSWIGALAIFQALSAGVAETLVEPASERLDAAERAWKAGMALRYE